LQEEAVGGDDAVVEDVVYVGLGGETVEGGCVVFGGGRLDGGDAEVLAAAEEASAGGGEMGFGVGGDGSVAIEDEVAVGRSAVGVDLGSREPGTEDGYKNDTAEENAQIERCCGSAESGYAGSGLTAVEHGCTSEFGLRCASAWKGFG
jgi:hypothetical protein